MDNSFQIEVLDHWSPKAKTANRLVAEVYSQFASTPPPIAEVAASLCEDGYATRGLTRTVLVSELNHTSGSAAPAATLRVAFTEHNEFGDNHSAMEFETLVRPTTGWAAFRDSFQFTPETSVEIGRFALASSLWSRESLKTQKTHRVLNILATQANDIAHDLNRPDIWSLMRRSVASILQRSGVDMSDPIPVDCLHEQNSELFHTYDRYWLDGQVHLYKLRLRERW